MPAYARQPNYLWGILLNLDKLTNKLFDDVFEWELWEILLDINFILTNDSGLDK